MRILGLDYGEKRIGVAVSDELGITAQGLTVLERKNRRADMEALRRLIEEYEVEKIVVGYPVRMDGTKGIQCEKVDRFARRLEETFGLPVLLQEELLTTKEAEEILRAAGTGRKKRKAVVDKLAAVLILRSYLDRPAISSAEES
ncbi:MAG: Holliday junction resolvase RuvX [Syntrophaceae bacterium]|nr:Holliday junction resolvase RuvX [Syntrophaceae bacterium]